MSLLDVRDLRAGYGPVRILHGLSFSVEEGEVAVILGANGAGKTTTLRALSGMIPSAGSIVLNGRELRGMPSEKVARAGVAHVPQGRGTFGDLTVEENLRVGGLRRRDGRLQDRLERWYGVFPRLGERRSQQAAGLSGGEQQMLAIARALMPEPKLLLLDEPSLGLAPNTTEQLFQTLAEINAQTRTTMIIVEQNAHLALQVGSNGFVLEAGAIVARDSASGLQGNDDVRRAYLGY